MSPFLPKKTDELEQLGKELYENTGIDYKDILADLEKSQKEHRERLFRNDTNIDDSD